MKLKLVAIGSFVFLSFAGVGVALACSGTAGDQGAARELYAPWDATPPTFQVLGCPSNPRATWWGAVFGNPGGTEAVGSGRAYSVSIADALPDPSGGNTYCFEPEVASQGTWNEYLGNHYKFSVTGSGGGPMTFLVAAVRIYTECYDSSDTYFDDEYGPVDLAYWPLTTPEGTNTMSVDVDHDLYVWTNLTAGTDYILYGIQVSAWLETGPGTILASATWSSWSDGAKKVDLVAHSQPTQISGWFSFHNTSQPYGPPNRPKG